MSVTSEIDECLILLDEIERLITRANQLKLKDSAFLLNVAHLDLQTKIHEISDDELQAIAEFVGSRLQH
jgi:hypothetical protein